MYNSFAAQSSELFKNTQTHTHICKKHIEYVSVYEILACINLRHENKQENKEFISKCQQTHKSRMVCKNLHIKTNKFTNKHPYEGNYRPKFHYNL